MIDGSCARCRYWLRIDQRRHERLGLPGELRFWVDAGECRRRAPVEHGNQPWQFTYETDWCGEYEATEGTL